MSTLAATLLFLAVQAMCLPVAWCWSLPEDWKIPLVLLWLVVVSKLVAVAMAVQRSSGN